MAIFVKTPALSPVKTRLWPRLGQPAAEAFHLAAAQAVASVARCAAAIAPVSAYWAVAEPDATRAWSDLPQLAQGEGSLGERMGRVYQELLERHSGAILVGADAPQLTPAALVQAAGWLSASEPRLVIGAARDGGFWLFGGNVRLPQAAWTAVRYSAADTAVEFVDAMRAHGRWLELDILGDVDSFDDLAPVLAELRALRHPTAAQQRLTNWMGATLGRGGSQS